MNVDDSFLVYEENRQLNDEIRNILEGKASDREKLKALRRLRDSTRTPLGRSHAAYYMEEIHAGRRERRGRLISVLVIGIWLAWILYRIWLYLHPETYHIVSILGITGDQSIYVLFLLPVAILVYYIIVYLMSAKNRAGKVR